MSTVITSPTHGRVLICGRVLTPAAEIETVCAGVTGGSGPSPKMHYSLSGRCQTSGNEPGITIKPTLMSIRRLFITDRLATTTSSGGYYHYRLPGEVKGDETRTNS
ncbi:hypothetical protein J6590_097654 [Homalodisca vitripennis]|nr:hypothetical protein J6590_097654 [Homalodisca vitripennis]